MADLPFPSATSNVWPRTAGFTTPIPSTAGPISLGGSNSIGLPTVNNPNLPPSTILNTGNIPPPVPQPPRTPFPSLQQPFNTASTNTNLYATAQSFPPFNPTSTNYGIGQSFPPFNPAPTNLVPNPAQTVRSEANHRRLIRLEDENAQQQNATSTLQQMGTQMLQNQMDVQEQVLQYQFMLEQCMETLDHQNFVVNGQAEELALLRAKMRHFEYLMDAIRHTKENEQHRRSTSGDSNLIDGNNLCSKKLLSLYGPAGSPFFPGGVTRVTSSKFQPFNPRYRSPNSRSANRNESRSITPAVPNPTNTNTRLSRPVSNTNN